MFVRTYVSSFLDSNSYVVYNDKYMIIIDPSVPYEKIRADFKQTLVGIFITHGHFDHFYELKSYLNVNNPDLKVFLHKNAIEKLQNSYLNYSSLYKELEINCDSRFVTVEEVSFKYYDFDISLILTPGHSDCSYTILIDDLLFTGDFLFKESIGRTDLYTGSSFIMNQSLKKIMNLELLKKYDDYYIYPGHGDYTTLNYEKKYNYYLKMIK